jgi:hypothetical protein
MRYTCETLRDRHAAQRELVFRPIYAGHAIGLDFAMVTRRVVTTAAVLLVLFGAGCGGDSGTKVAAIDDPAVVVPAAPAVESTTTTALPVAPPPADAPEPAAVDPVVNAAPTPASIQIDYQPQEGAAASATITGADGSFSKPLDGGAALFRELPPGSYSVTITVDTPSGNPSIGDSRVIINGGQIHVEPGQSGVLSCDDTGCY